ncbi:MAG: DMT family transporter [Flavobacterium sp.]|nr:DMT family transporter [Flavobacterium sp.]
MTYNKKSNTVTGISLAVLAAVIWSGNFIIARSISPIVPPVMLAFLRWFFATLIIAPIAWHKFQQEKQIIWQHKGYFILTSFMGFTCYNVLLYIAGHYTTAINLALIGSVSAPIFAVIIAKIIFKEHVPLQRVIGLVLCVIGIVILIAQGSLQRLVTFRFAIGDLWSLLGAVMFALYNNLTKYKPKGVSDLGFLFTGFSFGTTMLVPFVIAEHFIVPTNIPFNVTVISSVAYLSIGCSVIAYLFWNRSIHLIGPSRTVLFSNLIPILSTIEAVVLLGEHFTSVHIISGIIVLIGLVIANITSPQKKY